MIDSPPPARDRLAELRDSAKGWHGVQLAALGFIGLCGVIQTGDARNPWALQVMSGIFVLVAFVLACAGIYLVGRAAWPLYRGAPQAGGDDEVAVAVTGSLLTRGLALTFVSIAVLALATVTSWWPQQQDDTTSRAPEIQLQTRDGRTACGELTEAPQTATLRVIADDEPVDVAIDALASISPVSGC